MTAGDAHCDLFLPATPLSVTTLAPQTGSFASPPHDGYAFARQEVERGSALISTCHHWQTQGKSGPGNKVKGERLANALDVMQSLLFT